MKVEKKVRDFIRGELKTLLGLAKPVEPVEVKFPLEDSEIKVLKMWAAVLKAKPNLTGNVQAANNAAPSVNPAPAPAARLPEPPKLNKVAAPTLPTQAAPAASKPVVKRGRTRKIVEKEIVTPTGVKHKYKMDATGQTMPQGNTGRIPPARTKEEMEAQIATMANQQASIAGNAGGIVGAAIQYSLNKKEE